MNCPSCGAATRLEPSKDCMICDYCKNVYLPEKVDDGVDVFPETSENTCPVCSVSLKHASLAKIRIQYCTKCHGMLIPMGVFLSLVEELRAGPPAWLVPPPPDPAELRRRLACPQCHKPMETHYYSGGGNVIIEDCERCELNWLDRGELMRIVRAPDRSHRGSEPMV